MNCKEFLIEFLISWGMICSGLILVTFIIGRITQTVPDPIVPIFFSMGLAAMLNKDKVK